MAKILLVEDDDTISFGIRASLEKKGYEITACTCLAGAKKLFSDAFALVLLDLNLPDGTGYELCTWVKARCDTPIIFLTVRDEVSDITRGLDMGADDYVTKPFHIAVLESRIAAVLRRVPEEPDGSAACGNIRLNKEKMQVLLDGREITLTALEYRMLLILMENKGRTLPRSLILEKLWDSEGNFVNDNTLTVTVKRLREKLDHTRCITTVRGIGYRMEEAGDGI
ncbi:MAG: response regulator transcription factor [Schaedlerella sp.]|jgi:DNA-binding response OmpR family regulator|uniref:response regulator transcription factor n=1 Tax=Schaedlerella sp. TaxID=2676057 RepID=UPI0013633EF1|nr:response regulator transcription factor [uncultured Schaedlerella sp.]MCI8767148.1 response regulator transcription factor [Ruminococcus sp.]NBJ01747.1 DNA-binding response regulator [Lachnospiraceae bacterium]